MTSISVSLASGARAPLRQRARGERGRFCYRCLRTPGEPVQKEQVEQFWIIRDHARSGPFSESEILRAYRDGELKPADRLWAEGLPRPVSVSEAFALLRGPKPPREIDLALVDVDTPSRASDSSPYRPPLASLEDHGEGMLRFAGFWVRYAASLLDAIILAALGMAVGAVLGMGISLLGAPPDHAEWFIAGGGFIVGCLYFALGESSRARATLGKRAFHLQVLGGDELNRISFLRATGRLFARCLSVLPLMLGYLMQPFNVRKRALHDFICGTVVVVQREYSRLLLALMVVLGLAVPVLIGAALYGPAYQYFVVLGKVSAALRQVTPATVAIRDYLTTQGRPPDSLEEAGFETNRRLAGVRQLTFDAATGVITVTFDFAPVDGKTILIIPDQIRNAGIKWSCRAGTLPSRWVPWQCPPDARG
jgi:uncharacterized RDD family membrane protein YckC